MPEPATPQQNIMRTVKREEQRIAREARMMPNGERERDATEMRPSDEKRKKSGGRHKKMSGDEPRTPLP